MTEFYKSNRGLYIRSSVNKYNTVYAGSIKNIPNSLAKREVIKILEKKRWSRI